MLWYLLYGSGSGELRCCEPVDTHSLTYDSSSSCEEVPLALVVLAKSIRGCFNMRSCRGCLGSCSVSNLSCVVLSHATGPATFSALHERHHAADGDALPLGSVGICRCMVKHMFFFHSILCRHYNQM